jgi:hypothetical protein
MIDSRRCIDHVFDHPQGSGVGIGALVESSPQGAEGSIERTDKTEIETANTQYIPDRPTVQERKRKLLLSDSSCRPCSVRQLGFLNSDLSGNLT